MRLTEAEVMTEEDFQDWLQETVRKWPEIESIHLTGSRAEGYHSEDSDYDLIICLPERYYKTETTESGYEISNRKDDTELRIAQDRRRPALDIFFLRPDGVLIRHNYADSVYDGSGEQAQEAFMDGSLLGDFDRLYKSLKDAKELYTRERLTDG